MDDSKAYAQVRDIDSLKHRTKVFSDDIGMNSALINDARQLSNSKGHYLRTIEILICATVSLPPNMLRKDTSTRESCKVTPIKTFKVCDRVIAKYINANRQAMKSVKCHKQRHIMTTGINAAGLPAIRYPEGKIADRGINEECKQNTRMEKEVLKALRKM